MQVPASRSSLSVYLSEVGRHPRYLGILLYFQQGKRYTYMVIQVAVSGVGDVFFAQHRSDQFVLAGRRRNVER